MNTRCFISTWILIMMLLATGCGEQPLASATSQPTTSPSAKPPLPTGTNTFLPTATATPTYTPRPTATQTATIMQATGGWPAASAQGLHHGRILEPEGGTELVSFFLAPDGGLYLVGREGNLLALDSEGSLRWQSDSKLEAWMFGISPDREQLYSISADNVIYAMDSQDGSQLWKVAVSESLNNLPFIAPTGDIYLTTGGYSQAPGLKRLSASGKTLPFTWPQQVDQLRMVWDLLFGPQNELVVQTYDRLTVLEPDGALLHDCSGEMGDHFNRSTGLEVGMIGDQPAVFYVDQADAAVARSLDCRELWRLPLSKQATTTPYKDQAVSSTAIAWSQAGMLYIGRSDGQVLAIDPMGQLVWSTPPNEHLGELVSLMISPDGQVYALGSLSYFISITPVGQEIWGHEFYDPGTPYNLVALPDGAAMIQGNKVHFFNTDRTQVVEDPPGQPPEKADQNRQKLEQILLEHLLRQAFGMEPGDYQMVDQPQWERKPEEAALLVQLGPASDPYLDMFMADYDKVLRAWWYCDGKLYAATDPQQAITEFEKGYQDGYATPTWTRYNFSLLAISEDGLQAQAYIDWNCGDLCGQGRALTLKRSLSGEWWVVKDEMTWIS